MNNRRKLIIAFGASALLGPRDSYAQQQSKVWRIGFLGAATASGYASRMAALRAGLREFGYVEGKNLILEYRWAEGKPDRLPELAAELVRLNVDVIVTHATTPTMAAMQATKTIPIVMAVGSDPVAGNLVASLARPGGNVTGSTNFVRELGAKRIEVLKETVPRITRVAVLSTSGNPAQVANFELMADAARSLKVEIQQFFVEGANDYEGVFSAMMKRKTDSVVINEDGLAISNARGIAEIASKHRLPIAGFTEIAEGGGLIAYGVNTQELWRRAGYFVDKILKGANPGDLPMEQATKFELILNMRTARALGIKIPNSILVRADKVIEWNKRRDLIVALGAGAIAVPLASFAQQQGKVWRIGFLSSGSGITSYNEGFRQELPALGYVEGKNIVIEWRFAKGVADLLPEFAAELVRLKVDCLVTNGANATIAAKLTTPTIPIVMGNSDDDPVRLGLVASLARPGGNVTGFTSISTALSGKRLQLLKETLPKLSRVAILFDPDSRPASAHIRAIEAAARTLGVRLQYLEVRNPDVLEQMFQAAAKGQAQAAIAVSGGLMTNLRTRIASLADKSRLPVMHTGTQAVLAGGLMGYGADQFDQFRGAAQYVDRILKGAKPADLPVQQPTKFEFIINLKAAKQIGLTIPRSVLAQATRVIE